MHAAMVLSIIFGGSVIILAIIGSTILIAIKIIKGGVSRAGQKTQSEEARMIQEIYQGLARMEDRVEALETLIIDQDGKDRS